MPGNNFFPGTDRDLKTFNLRGSCSKGSADILVVHVGHQLSRAECREPSACSGQSVILID